ncbi:MAG: hypothetical protein RR614_14825, partial [Eubacterium sp.]
CHYCADFFCEAHTDRYEGGLRAHIQYEKNLYHYTKLNKNELGDLMYKPGRFDASDTGDIFRKIEQRNDTYLSGRPSYRAQSMGALSTCLEA